MKAPQDLAAPALKDSGLHLTEPPQVSAEGVQPGLWWGREPSLGSSPSPARTTVCIFCQHSPGLGLSAQGSREKLSQEVWEADMRL